jgi:predicted HTH transcriptional regulator
MATKKSKANIIKYDIDLDIKIVNTITLSSSPTTTSLPSRYNCEKTTYSELRTMAACSQNKLDEHLENLVKWGLITDRKPKRTGQARIVKLAAPYGDVMRDLMRLKDAIDTVNEFFVS